MKILSRGLCAAALLVACAAAPAAAANSRTLEYKNLFIEHLGVNSGQLRLKSVALRCG
jgi:hypothetical protein